MNPTPRVPFLSGIKPTGDLHLGNYFGAIQQFINLHQQHQDGMVMIADMHALNQMHDAEALQASIKTTLLGYLACGLDPKKVSIFQQSAVIEHVELATVLGALCPLGLMERAHAYKDALANGKEANVGLFTYPILMAADILLYKPAGVPVGKDQQQHVEIAIDLSEKFNHTYSPVFPEPRLLLQADTAIVPGTDGRKMSKSYGNVIGLLYTEVEVAKKVATIVTDSRGPAEAKDPDTCNIFALHRLVGTAQELAELDKDYRSGSISYKGSKDLLAMRINRFLQPIRERHEELVKDPSYLEKVLVDGSKRAKEIAGETMAEVREAAGLILHW